MEVGEYVRTKDGIVDKIDSFEKDLRNVDCCCFQSGRIYTVELCNDIIIKHSFNLIDLIENNDIVLIKTKGTQFVNLGIVRKREDQRSGKLNILVNGQNTNEFEILKVLTHEQYEANCYKVKGE